LQLKRTIQTRDTESSAAMSIDTRASFIVLLQVDFCSTTIWHF